MTKFLLFCESLSNKPLFLSIFYAETFTWLHVFCSQKLRSLFGSVSCPGRFAERSFKCQKQLFDAFMCCEVYCALSQHILVMRAWAKLKEKSHDLCIKHQDQNFNFFCNCIHIVQADSVNEVVKWWWLIGDQVENCRDNTGIVELQLQLHNSGYSTDHIGFRRT